MKLLALDTAANLCSVAILDVETGILMAEVSEDIGKGHAERLMAVIEQVMEQSKIAIANIGKIAVSVGPGSFTGVRVGVSTARGFALALKCPVVGISTLQALAYDAAKTIPGIGRSCRSSMPAATSSMPNSSAQDGSATSEPMVTTLPLIAGTIGQSGVTAHVLAGSGARLIERKSSIDPSTSPQSTADRKHRGRSRGLARSRMGRRRSAEGRFTLRGLDVKQQQGFVLKRKVVE